MGAILGTVFMLSSKASVRRRTSWSSKLLETLHWRFTGIVIISAAGLLWLWELPSRRRARANKSSKRR